MALHKRPLDSVRDLLDDAEALDINLTGGTFLRDADVALYTDALLGEIRSKFGTTVEIERFEPAVNGVLLSVLPQHRNIGVLLLCKGATHLVSNAQYDETNGVISVTFNLRPPVNFCVTLAWVVFLYALAAACFFGGDAILPAHQLVHAIT